LASARLSFMKTHDNLWSTLCSYENLEHAYRKARKHKTTKWYVVEFEKNLKENLILLQSELLSKTYLPKPLKTFIIIDPKTRKISRADFRDRVIHHALCNIIEPIFEKIFIYDSYANRIGKGTLKAVQRFDYFKRKVSRNNTKKCYVLKADIKKYFENIDRNILLDIIKSKIIDGNVLWLVQTIMSNHKTNDPDKGMPLGNLTSQFFANVYLNELDYFVKHKLKVKHYLRYVDDFVILHKEKNVLGDYKTKINIFLKKHLNIELHPDKSKVILLKRGIDILGFRVFYFHKLLKKNNTRRMRLRLKKFREFFPKDYDGIYESIQGWIAYARNADTYALRKNIFGQAEILFSNQIASTEINRWLKAMK
jgi:RNA-directed DNA polymerase